MIRRVALVTIASLSMTFGAGVALAQDSGEAPSTTSKAPLRPFDPPLPEAVFIPDLVSDLVVTDLGRGLAVSPLTANPPAQAPGTGNTFNWSDWAEFALPALVPLFLALALIALTRVPARRSDGVHSESPS